MERRTEEISQKYRNFEHKIETLTDQQGTQINTEVKRLQEVIDEYQILVFGYQALNSIFSSEKRTEYRLSKMTYLDQIRK